MSTLSLQLFANYNLSFSTSAGSHRGFCSWVNTPASCEFPFSLGLSNFGGTSLLWILSSLMDPRKDIDFSVCSSLYLVLEQNDNFWALYILDQKLDVPKSTFDLNQGLNIWRLLTLKYFLSKKLWIIKSMKFIKHLENYMEPHIRVI